LKELWGNRGVAVNAYIEGYGCSLNQGDTEKIKFLLTENSFTLSNPGEADFIIVNSCAVKTATENKVLRSIKALNSQRKQNSKLIVTGCLPLVSKEKILSVCNDAILFGTELEELSSFLGLNFPKSKLALGNLKANPNIAIIPVSHGCLSNCAYCCVKQARGNLRSYTIKEINEAFRTALKTSNEIWITATDLGCYGFDIETNLAELLFELLKNNGEYRIRLGMMNPAHLKKYLPELLKAMEDERVYKFLHVPIQSGSDKVLKLMQRNNSVKEFSALVNTLRKKFPDLMISTDIIAGFPGETERDFIESVALIEALNFDLVNISRFALRPNTKAVSLPNHVPTELLRARTRILAGKAFESVLSRNRRFENTVQKVLVSRRGSKGGFVCRTNAYKPVIVEEAKIGEFLKVKIEKAFRTYLVGKRLSN